MNSQEKNEKTDESGRGKNSAKGDNHVETVSLPECSSASAAFLEELHMEQQIYLNTPTVSSESLESSNLNINTLQSESIYIHEEASNDLVVERRDSETASSEQLKKEIRILTNKVKLLQSKLSKHRKDKKKIKRVKRRLGKSFCYCNIF